MVEAVGWVGAFVIVSEQLSRGERVVGLLTKGAVGNVVLAEESVDKGTVDPGDVEVISNNGEDGVGVVRLDPNRKLACLWNFEPRNLESLRGFVT